MNYGSIQMNFLTWTMFTKALVEEGVAIDLKEVQEKWLKEVEDALTEATVD